MNSLSDPFLTFIIVLLIGIVAGVLAQHYLRTSWIPQQFTGGRRAAVTSALVGIAGAFIGFHVGILLNLAGSGSIALFIAAAIGAALILWGWKTARL
jgi:uncharacterized membrane protein YeaQ/YmgE (transglycosylase-associated protein family)